MDVYSADVDCDLPYSGRRSCRVDHILTLEFFNVREVRFSSISAFQLFAARTVFRHIYHIVRVPFSKSF